MKRFVTFGMLMLAALAQPSLAEESGETAGQGVTYRAMPTLSSNPSSGTGVGAMLTGIYHADKASSPSQAILNGQYTNTDSYNLFAINKMFFDSDRWQSNTVAGMLYNNSGFDFPADWLPPVSLPINPDDGIQYNVNIYVIGQQLMYRIKPHFYLGGQLVYIDQSFSGTNLAGELFLKSRGIEDASRGGYGLTLSYDTRTKSEKFYPTNSSWVDLVANHFPEFMGINAAYYNLTLNARKYIHGIRSADVFAMQLYGQYSSENTPDGALAALGARNIIRGFPIGLYKTRHMLAAQGEYRYRVGQSRFRLTAFAGYASLTGGSKGTTAGNREADNGDYYSGGLGVHYILAEKQQLDYRVNVAYTSEDEASIYASINQAF
ncbi:MAG TPA: hypothetical protein ENJ11_00800 [Gammaproteobacteria bacterium]|nr:hypothetical protein [Gammaproteobacteria bacterium]